MTRWPYAAAGAGHRDWVLDLDIRAFFDSVPHSLLLKAVADHTGERWVLLYISRWLEAPMQMPDGTIVRREKGTPQGSPVSPLLANLFMHYAFDTWMDREFPGCPFERYADDIIAHCGSEDQARQLRVAIAARLETLGLELHPGKTKVAYCKDETAGGTSGTPASISSATPSGAVWPRGQEAISPASPRPSAPRRRRRKASRSGTGTSTAAAARTCPAWPGVDQSSGPRLDQLLRSLLPLRVVLPGMAHQRAPGPVGDAQVQAIPRQVRQGDGLAAEGVSVQAWPVRPLAADRVHLGRTVGAG